MSNPENDNNTWKCNIFMPYKPDFLTPLHSYATWRNNCSSESYPVSQSKHLHGWRIPTQNNIMVITNKCICDTIQQKEHKVEKWNFAREAFKENEVKIIKIAFLRKEKSLGGLNTYRISYFASVFMKHTTKYETTTIHFSYFIQI